MFAREEAERETELFRYKYKPAANARRGKMANRAVYDAVVVMVRASLNPAQNPEHPMYRPDRIPIPLPDAPRGDGDDHKINIDE